MAAWHRSASSSPTPLRVWPGVAIVLLQWLVRFGMPLVVPDVGMFAVLGGAIGGLVILVWWLAFSRAPWTERLGAVALTAGALAVTSRLVHPSIANGMMGLWLVMYSIPVMSLVLVGWAVLVARRQTSPGVRWVSLLVAVVVACGAFTLLRTGGVTGTGASELAWRWTPSPEERLLSQSRGEPVVPNATAVAVPAIDQPVGHAGASTPPTPVPPPGTSMPPSQTGTAATPDSLTPPSTPAVAIPAPEWPGFRGVLRDGIVRGVRIDTDWSRHPPVQVWRRPIGPGWSSFAVQGGFLYTQEQRGDDELVSAYRVSTGEPIWQHRDSARFWESNGGAGPRATPTFSDGRIYALGATGILNALDSTTGTRVWSRQVTADAEAKVPIWGFSASPLVTDGMVIVAAGGRLIGYDAASGERRWLGPDRGGGYSSPQGVSTGGAAQVLLMSEAGLISLAPATGALLWEHSWKGEPIIQPAVSADGDILASTSGPAGGLGIRLLAITSAPGGWTAVERWTSTGLKPYFNDFVVHAGHAYGFDGSILACIDLKDGTRRWKGGRYGNGQLVLLPDQDVLLVLSEDGELALVGATPDRFAELARLPAIDGKTWNHPVIVGDTLLVRNGETMAAYRLPQAAR